MAIKFSHAELYIKVSSLVISNTKYTRLYVNNLDINLTVANISKAYTIWHVYTANVESNAT